MSERAKRLVGYTDPLSVAPGDRLSVKVSSAYPSFRASLVRIRRGGLDAQGTGAILEELGSAFEGTYEGNEQPYPLGSYMVAPGVEVTAGFSVAAWLLPTTPSVGEQGIVTRYDARSASGWGLFLAEDGRLSLWIGADRVTVQERLRPWTWYFVAGSLDPATGRAYVEHTARHPWPSEPRTASAVADVTADGATDVALVVGGHVAEAGEPVGRLNGKVDTPRLFGRPLAPDQLVELREGAVPEGLLSEWDFAAAIGGDSVPDRGPAALAGRLVNGPMQAVTGHAWTGREVDFRNARDEYAATFFHADDLDDARWEESFAFDVPGSLRSGVYGIRLRAGEEEDVVPFFVRAPRGRPTARIAVLLSTLSYLAYANEHVSEKVPELAETVRQRYSAEDRLAIEVPLLSLYDHHADGSGVCTASRLRPLATMRPHYHHPALASAHQLAADLHLTDWLEEKGFSYDVLTDEELHAEGVDALSAYRVVLTGAHPEYWTGEMLDGLDAYLSDGGRFMYLGGNGLYWVTTIDPARPHVMEVRRGRRGTGTWRSAPGEDHHAGTGEPGGLWRDRGRAPNRLVGVGMTAQGFTRSQPYVREAGSRDPAAAFIFDGVGDGPIGAEGLVLGGAAGYEIDRLDHGLGSPFDALLLASARSGFSDSYQHVVEEVEMSDSQQGGTTSPLVRADLVYFRTPRGGAVFSTGSIAWCGSLSHDGYDNAVSRITGNVLEAFSGDVLP